MTNIEAMKQALEALKAARHGHCDHAWADEAIADLDAAIEAAEKQEPVAWEDVLGAIARGWAHPENARKPMDVQLAVAIAKEIQDMYTTPPAAQRERVVFPTMLRKMWSGGEVQAWLDENVNGIKGEV